jgi:hypothetical protein
MRYRETRERGREGEREKEKERECCAYLTKCESVDCMVLMSADSCDWNCAARLWAATHIHARARAHTRAHRNNQHKLWGS